MKIDVVINYTNAKGETSDYQGIFLSEFGDYFRLKVEDSFRTFRKDRVNQYISGIEHLVEPLAQQDYNKPKKERKASRFNKDCLPEICFTGFSKADKARLETAAKAAGFYPTKRHVTVHLLALCCGDNAGPAKLKKAKEQGCLILDETAFYQLIETGEIPEE